MLYEVYCPICKKTWQYKSDDDLQARTILEASSFCSGGDHHMGHIERLQVRRIDERPPGK